MEPASATCERCLAFFCSECLVFPFGSAKRPLCVRCALNLAGIRIRLP
jgi:hypothetical protein